MASILSVVAGGIILVGEKRYTTIIEKEKFVGANPLRTTNNAPQIESFCASRQFFVKESKNMQHDFEFYARERAECLYFRNHGRFLSPFFHLGGRKRRGGSAFVGKIAVESVGSFIAQIVQRWANVKNSQTDSRKANEGNELSPLVSSSYFWTSTDFDKVGNVAAQMVAVGTFSEAVDMFDHVFHYQGNSSVCESQERVGQQ